LFSQPLGASQKLSSSVVTLARLTIVTPAVTLAVEVATGFSLILLLLYMVIGGVALVASVSPQGP